MVERSRFRTFAACLLPGLDDHGRSRVGASTQFGRLTEHAPDKFRFSRVHVTVRSTMRAVDELERGRESHAMRAWNDAYESLSRADEAASLSAKDLELLARSAYMLGRDDDYVHGLERAHHAYLSAHEGLRAVRCAFWIGHNLLFRGDTVGATGWFARANRLLERESEDCVERGYLLIPVWLKQMGGGDYKAGYATAAEAAAIGERFEDDDLRWLAVDEQGRALINQGRVEEGLQLVDEVLVVANARELSPIVTGIVYCNTIAFCRGVYQLRHAREWTRALTRWCEEQPEMVAHNGLCLVHRAEMMQLQGAWADALGEARLAAERFTQGILNQLACGKAFYRQAEVHRLRGDFAAADNAYRQASRCGSEPQPGLALLRLAQANADPAVAAIRRAVSEATAPMPRADLLPAYIEIMLAVGDVEEAASACRELEGIAEGRRSDALTALSAHARGAVALAHDDPHPALTALRRATQGWQELEAPYEGACTRVLVGLACRLLGDEETALLEFDAARETFLQLGAEPDLARIHLHTRRGSSAATHGLTTRELEVLRLVARGKSNHAIAADLFVSDHTIRRHLQNIFRKLGVSSRAAATAFAFQHDLV
jgi:DNA-binding NarL/FixJ family response regulator